MNNFYCRHVLNITCNILGKIYVLAFTCLLFEAKCLTGLKPLNPEFQCSPTVWTGYHHILLDTTSYSAAQACFLLIQHFVHTVYFLEKNLNISD